MNMKLNDFYLPLLPV
ncbi:hypothetical protein, partial [Escherichia coli]